MLEGFKKRSDSLSLTDSGLSGMMMLNTKVLEQLRTLEKSLNSYRRKAMSKQIISG
jgi:hypothetical protein